jgi:hypothetical protein
MRGQAALAILSASVLLVSCWTSREESSRNWNIEITDRGGAANIGINISEMTYYSTEFVFKDLAKTMVAVRTGSGFTEAQFDENGYPLYLAPGQSIDLSYGIDTDFAFPEGQYHVFFDGEGTIESVYNTAALASAAGPGHQVWTVTHASDSQVGWRIAATKAFRFMDWLATNNSPVTEWAQMKGAGYITQVGYSGEWGHQTFASDTRGASVESALELCDAMDKDIWICVPHQASDDLVRRMAVLVRDNLEPGRKAYLEYSNELWNWGFQQTEYCDGMGRDLHLENGGLDYSVRRSGEIFRIWEDAWGAGSSRLINVWAWQNVDDYWMYIGLDAFSNPDVNPSGARPELYATAPYFTGGDGDPPSSIDELFEEALFGSGNYCLSLLDGLNRARFEKLAPYGIAMGCYEAGQHYSTFSADPALDDSIYIPANRDARMGTCYRKFLADWQNANPGGLMMLYSSCGMPSKWGSWGILERWDRDASSSPKYAAVKEFAEAH